MQMSADSCLDWIYMGFVECRWSFKKGEESKRNAFNEIHFRQSFSGNYAYEVTGCVQLEKVRI